MLRVVYHPGVGQKLNKRKQIEIMDLTYPIEVLLKEAQKLNEQRETLRSGNDAMSKYIFLKQGQVFEAVEILQKLHNEGK